MSLFEKELYTEAMNFWPTTGKVILAQYDDQGIWVYQAFNAAIACYAAEHKKFTGCSSYSPFRMSWIKPNFLWMQFRSGWGQKPNQERCLAIKLRRDFFNDLVAKAVASNCNDSQKLQNSEVIVQWDPDHDPKGGKCERRAMQLGLRGETLAKMVSGEVVLDILDITEFVQSQSQFAMDATKWDQLLVAKEREYLVI
uniref:DUF4291 domain-containing protein n=1 Tax=Cyanoptyche gloeocystis TaxID=77922 RepID=A0A7S2JKV0_9EUKA|mmetsp:Transcript_1729/g.3303  ORF Transcript_1729/g.3303 Transcript_1729/m.3303 type:complete len:197 (+) Transcript_1729:220-810(+)|eukprot:CAMPEP_0196667058 /NCGR_PEP_ID=MMETSP1086-20130531/64870_1 /TAXON_ID=77921 /ORGANISM="Cyanoptyche  gloeocystis , Strain SAG4.97" /LENGTH=196 /DNA_ID=CAMNT_0042004343 /DNA_START=209 /DNA_END=799 /DNA_ORIENTATION=-